jgi:hypothetical protein
MPANLRVKPKAFGGCGIIGALAAATSGAPRSRTGMAGEWSRLRRHRRDMHPRRNTETR